MAMFFPGMDPYLEDPLLWEGFHNRFVVHVADFLQPLIRPRYVTSVEERVFVEGPTERQIIPDVWVREKPGVSGAQSVAVVEADVPIEIQAAEGDVKQTYIEILDRKSGQKVVTVIEVLSPTNKFPGEGQKSYLDKQREVRESQAHLVEIDLLRMGNHVLAVPAWATRKCGAYDYLVCVNRAEGIRDRYQLYPWRVRSAMPRIRIPLAAGDQDVNIDLRPVLAHTYEAGSYQDRIDYSKPCMPPLAGEDQAWADELIQAAGIAPLKS